MVSYHNNGKVTKIVLVLEVGPWALCILGTNCTSKFYHYLFKKYFLIFLTVYGHLMHVFLCITCTLDVYRDLKRMFDPSELEL